VSLQNGSSNAEWDVLSDSPPFQTLDKGQIVNIHHHNARTEERKERDWNPVHARETSLFATHLCLNLTCINLRTVFGAFIYLFFCDQ